jgi:hypothetical protein
VIVNAYVLAADPTWLRSSIGAYYPFVGRIVVSYDEQAIGWSGAPIPVQTCLDVIADSDPEGKVELLAGDYSDPGGDLMQADTRQRQAALAVAGTDADWVLQLDGDEILPDPGALLRILHEADSMGFRSVEWPMRVLFRRLPSGGYLEVVERDGSVHVEYPGAIAVRPDVELSVARRTDEPFLRVTATSAASGLQLQGPPSENEHRRPLISTDQVIWHNSWARSPAVIRIKTSSWSHSGWRTKLFYFTRWYPAPLMWWTMRDFHPVAPALWPQLRRLSRLPITLHPQDAESTE